ncbi:hypothetical protein [Caballeronia sp. LZ035]|uniref:hypothetical protein n=1 Tax=Caballeronia sp. LZ035 TaxID=3038568 RepID=UPI00285C4C45|nr:hypothetical protein [Caballeronia sp. LZ035]MDR5761455.1 hypothetical protein [Caballeronia sp. LZ035]
MRLSAAVAAGRFAARRPKAPAARARAGHARVLLRWRRAARRHARAASRFAGTAARKRDASWTLALHMHCVMAREGRPRMPESSAPPARGAWRAWTGTAHPVRRPFVPSRTLPAGSRIKAAFATALPRSGHRPMPRVWPARQIDRASMAQAGPHAVCIEAARPSGRGMRRPAGMRVAQIARIGMRSLPVRAGAPAAHRSERSPLRRASMIGPVSHSTPWMPQAKSPTDAPRGLRPLAMARAPELVWRKHATSDTGVVHHEIRGELAPRRSSTPPSALTARTGWPADMPAAAMTAAANAALDAAQVQRIADDVIRRVEKRVRIERERRGL